MGENLREKQLENIMCRPRLASTKFESFFQNFQHILMKPNQLHIRDMLKMMKQIISKYWRKTHKHHKYMVAKCGTEAF